jgi:hypothetical protein
MLQKSVKERLQTSSRKANRVSRVAAVVLSVWLVISGCSSSSSKSAADTAAAPAANFTVNQTGQAESKGVDSTLPNEAVKITSSTAGTASKEQPQALADKGQGANGTSGFAAVNTAQSLDRKVIYKGNLTMGVADYAAAQTEINNLVTLAGGYVLQFSENQSTAEQSGNYVIKVPANGFSSFIRDLEKIKTVTPIRHNIQGQDVSEEYVDLSSRLKAKQAVEARLLTFMEKATKTDDLLSFSNELATVQEAIEQIKGRMRYLDQNVSFSTIEIRLYEQGAAKSIEPQPGESTLAQMKHTLISSLHFMKVIVQGLGIFLAAVLPVLIAAAIIGIPIVYLVRKRIRAAAKVQKMSEYGQKIDTTELPPQDQV